MGNLSGWDFAEVFTGLEAAALMIGLDPTCDRLEKASPVLARMKQCYEKTLFAHRVSLWIPAMDKAGIRYIQIQREDDPFALGNLHSWRMSSYYDQCYLDEWEYANKTFAGLAELAEERFNLWLVDERLNGFDHQLFRRADLHGWLYDLNLTSQYEFLGPSTHGNAEAQPNGLVHNLSGRRDLLTPIIEFAQSQCRNGYDASEVWAKLASLAKEKHSPLIGCDEAGIQYLDASEQLKNLNVPALRMRLRRAR